MKETSRSAAFDILFKIYHDNAFTNLAIDASLKNLNFDNRDKALICAIVYGTIERTLTIDWILSKLLSQPIEKLKIKVLVILRLSIYQLYFMDKIPVSAVVNEGVNLTKEKGCAFASSLVNAVLRKAAENDIDIDDISDLSIKYSCPQNLINMWTKMYGEENTIGILESINDKPPIYIRVNSRKTNKEDLTQSLVDSGAEICDTYLENALQIKFSGDVSELKDFKDGNFHVQDLASQLCVKALGAQSGDVVYDMCSAPGGKAFTLAQEIGDDGKVMAFDIYDNRISLIESGKNRLGLKSIETAKNDACEYNENLPLADKVLCDVVCSGLGIIRKKPEVRYKSLDSIKELPPLQYKILNSSSKYVKAGGTLIYSTCALNKKENEQVVNLFLKNNPDFVAVPFLTDLPGSSDTDEYFTLFPHINQSDGFFIAKLERKI